MQMVLRMGYRNHELYESDFYYSICTITNVYFILREMETLESKFHISQETGFPRESSDNVNSTEFEVTMNFVISLCFRFVSFSSGLPIIP